MTWWGWLLVFVALAIGAVVVLFLQVRAVWRSAMALFTELGEASRKVEEVMAAGEALQRAAEQAPSTGTTGSPGTHGTTGAAPAPPLPDLAIFDSAARLRQDRARTHR